MISKKIKDVVYGVDAAAISKQSIGYWVSTLMPDISDDRFGQYAADIMHHTIRFINESKASQETGVSRKRYFSTTSLARTSTSCTLDEIPLKLTPYPRKKFESTQQQKYAGQESASQGHVPAVASKMPPPVPRPHYRQAVQQADLPWYQTVVQPRCRRSSSEATCYDATTTGSATSASRSLGPNMQLQPTSQLQPRQNAPTYLPSDLGMSPHNITKYDGSGRSYYELQPAKLTAVERLIAASWQTRGRAAQSAEPQESPTSGLDTQLTLLAKQFVWHQ